MLALLLYYMYKDKVEGEAPPGEPRMEPTVVEARDYEARPEAEEPAEAPKPEEPEPAEPSHEAPKPETQTEDLETLSGVGEKYRALLKAAGVRSVATLAGLVLAELGRVPQTGDVVRIGNVQLTVHQMRRRRVERLKIELIDVSSTPGQSTT